MGNLEKRLDAWANLISGVGVPGQDKTRDFMPYSRNSIGATISENDIATLFHESHVYRKGCFKPMEVGLGKGFDVALDDLDATAELKQELARIDATKKLQIAHALSRGFGGSAIWMIVDDGRSQDQPLDIARVERGSLSKLMAIDSRWLRPMTYYDSDGDVYNAQYLEPELFEFRRPDDRTLDAMLIHESRLLLFPGLHKTPDYRISGLNRRRSDWWGLPLAVPVFDALARNAAAMASAGYMVHDSSFSILKLGKLKSILSSRGADAISERAKAIELVRSVLRAVVIGDDEEYTRVAPNFGNFPDMLNEFKFDLANAYDMPATVLFGQSPAGMDATGESDLALWFSRLHSERELDLTPRIQRLIEVLTGGEITSANILYPPLDQPSEKEQAEIRLAQAQADRVYFDMGLPEYSVFLSRFTERGYSTETTIDRDAWEKLAEADKLGEGQEPIDGAVADPTPAPEDAPLPGAEKAQDTALNGAQVKALSDLAVLVSDSSIPTGTAIQIALVSFPITEAQARAIFDAIEPKEKPEPPAFPPPGAPPVNGQPQTPESPGPESEPPESD